jgi:hypothetical protein
MRINLVVRSPCNGAGPNGATDISLFTSTIDFVHGENARLAEEHFKTSCLETVFIAKHCGIGKNPNVFLEEFKTMECQGDLDVFTRVLKSKYGIYIM